MKRIGLLLLVLALSTVISGCGSTGPQANPESVVRAYIDAVRLGDLDKAKSLCSPDQQDVAETDFQSRVPDPDYVPIFYDVHLRTIWDIKTVVVRDLGILGTQATVVFTDGGEGTMVLEKLNDRWYINQVYLPSYY